MAESNTMLGPRVILGAATALVRMATPEDSVPFRISAVFEISIDDLLKSMDEFRATVLQPAIDAAMARKLPVTDRPGRLVPNGAAKEAVATWPDDGVTGHLVQYYDAPLDKHMIRIDIIMAGINDGP
jgi:hypothetical protein